MQHLDELKREIKERLPDLDLVIGWEQGFDPLRATPFYMKTPEDVDRMVWGPLCVHNLATQLTGLKGKKVGIVVKGCDSRAIVELLQEKLINRDEVVVFGLPCPGVISTKKIARQLGSLDYVESVELSGDSVVVTSEGKATTFPMADVASDKCGRCEYNSALLSDVFVGDAKAPEKKDDYADVAAFEEKSEEERMQHWLLAMDRCISCYACRNACPMCVCRDYCVAQSREPHWMSQEDSVQNKLLFQIIHTMHLAGRCVECGECERSCPMSIPILTLRRKMNKEINELFDYKAGTLIDAKPPLLSFKIEEENINERGW